MLPTQGVSISPCTFFQVYGVDAVGKVIVRKELRRSELSFLQEACGVPGQHGGSRNSAL